jgi:LmbE family N-acetylglucosaminyl deacetylase
MIVPLIAGEAWLEELQTVPTWQVPPVRAVVIAPHPDDETLGAGGLIKSLTNRGVDVTVVAVTDGEGAYSDGVDIRAVRRREQTQALKVLGVDEDRILRLGLPDRYLGDHEDNLVKLITPLVDKESHLVAPWVGDFHPDHEACGRAAQRIAKATGAMLSFYFFWTWHRGTPGLLKGLRLRSVPLTSSVIEAKGEAVRQHQSQLAHPSGEPILPADLLSPTLWPFEVFCAA